MKLLIQHTHSKGEIAGVLTYINSIEPELQQRGIETQILSTKETSPQEWLKSIIWADFIHMNSNHLIFALLCKLLGKKIILKYHYLFYLSTHSKYEPMSFSKRLKTELIHSLPKSNYPLKWKLHTIVKFARLATRFATAIVVDRQTTCSRFLAESYSFPWKIDILYNPIHVSQTSQKTLDTLSQPYSFVYVGRLSHDKGVDLLLKATKQLQTQDFQVLIIGDGNEAEKLKALAAQLEICDRVKFLGNQPQTVVLPVIKSALALVAPSRWQEPAGYIVLEASSVQTCSIVAKVGGLPEMTGPHGFQFEQENVEELALAMKTCLANPQDAIEQGEQASHYVSEHFSPVDVVNQLLEICQELSPSFTLKDSKI